MSSSPGVIITLTYRVDKLEIATIDKTLFTTLWLNPKK